MAAPELRLNVSLDLGFFRQQLRQLSTVASSEFNAPLKVKFDKTSLNNELRLLTNQLSRRKYAIQINDTSIKAARVNAQKLKNTLDLLTKQKYIVNVEYQQKGGPVGTGGGTQRSAGFASARQQVSNLTAEQLRNRAFQSLGKESRSAQQVSQWLDTVLQQGLKGGAKKKQLDAIRDYLADALASSARGGVEARMRGQNFGGGGKVQRSALDQIARAVFFMAGIDPAKLRAERRRIPSIDWQATAPSRGRTTGPSSTGRMLPPGYIPPGLPGTAMGSQRLLIGDILDPSLKNAAREAANSFVDAIRKGLNEAVRSVSVRDLGNALRPALTGSRVRGFLAPGVGRVSSPYATGRLGRDGETREELFARREREARMRSALRGVDVMGEGGVAGRPPSSYGYAYRGARPQGAIVPYAAGGAMVYSGPGGGGGTGGGPGNFAGRGGGPGGGFNMPNLPGAGLVREIGEEFGFAAKQVLLFGTAYKALAFLQGLPGQIGSAVGALQSFRNTLNAISPTAKDAAASNQLILDTVDKYNIPIQSARDGFTKLYASMKPAGFSGEQIGNLFLGISKASATLGLSSEKVDRVTYAFSQMASKGQLMSEEVSGQLGDVIPGALSIMAEAANMDIKTFKKAMEDGVFVGKAFEAVMSNVPIVLEKRFGKGAEGAAKTFQGALNEMQTSLTLLYEAFEPVAVGFLNAVVKPMTDGLQVITDGFNSFFTGQTAQTAGGAAFAKQLTDLKPAFEGILENIRALIPSFQLFGSLLLNAAKTLTIFAGNPIVGFLLKVYANVLLVNTAFTLLGGRVLLGAIASINAAIARMVALSVTMNALGVASTRAGASIAGTQLQMLLLQRSAAGAIGPVTTLLGSLLRLAGIGTIAVVVTIAISGLMQLAETEARIAKLRGEKNPVGPAGPRPIATAERRYVGATKEKVESDQRAQQEYVATLRSQLSSLRATQTKGGAALGQTAVGSIGNILSGFTRENTTAKITELELKIKNAEEVLNLNPQRYQTEAARQRASVTTMASATGGGAGGGGAGAKPRQERESQIPQLMLRLEKTRELSALELQISDATLMNNTAQLSALELAKQLVEFKYEAKELELQKLTAEEKGIARREIALRAEQAILASQLQLQIDLKKERDGIQQGFVDILAGYDEEFEYQQMYLNLINQGIRPSLAKARIEVTKTFKEQEKQLDKLIEQNETEIASLELLINKLKLQGNLSEEGKKQLSDAEKRLEILKEELGLRQGIKAVTPETKAAAMQKAEQGLAPKTVAEYLSEGYEEADDNLKQLANLGYQVVNAANAIGDAFSESFKGIISGSMTAQQALASFFQSVGDYFVDMAARMIAEWVKMQIIGLVQSLLAPVAGGFAGGLSSGFNAGTSSAIDTSGAGWGAAFSTPLKFANGGIAAGGFTAFANGGMVTGPTMGLVGEGRYNEAIVPLPNGKSIPVELGGGAGSQINSNITVNVNNGQAQSNATGSNSSELGRKIEGAVKQVIVGELRPGGLLASR